MRRAWLLGLLACGGGDKPSVGPGDTAVDSPTAPSPTDPTAPTDPTDPTGSGDRDGDGVADAADCAPDDPSVFPGATEVPYDGVDQDCAGGDLVDVDGDGAAALAAGGGDCADGDPTVGPGQPDLPYDGLDQACDGEGDADGDGDRHPAFGGADCDDRDRSRSGLDVDGDGETSCAADCDDEEPQVGWDRPAVCGDGLDQDCDGAPDCGLRRAVDAGSTTTLVHLELAEGAVQVAAGDLDADGLADLLLAQPAASAVGLAGSGAVFALRWPMDAARSWWFADLGLTGSRAGEGLGRALAVGDLTGDGLHDLFVGSGDGARLLAGPLAGELDSGAARSTWLGAGPVLAIGEVTGDGASDALASSATGLLVAPGPLAVGDLRPAGRGLTGGEARSLVVADLDGDGVDDVAVGQAGAVHLAFGPIVGLGRPDGGTLAGADQVRRAGDGDGDGLPDLWVLGGGTAWRYDRPEGDRETDSADARLAWSGLRSVDGGSTAGTGPADLVAGAADEARGFFGPLSGAIPLEAAELVARGEGLGAQVAWLGDVDGDGSGDLALADDLAQVWLLLGGVD